MCNFLILYIKVIKPVFNGSSNAADAIAYQDDLTRERFRTAAAKQEQNVVQPSEGQEKYCPLLAKHA